jgi:hypothetical protein
MKVYEVALPAMTPEKARIDALKRAKDQAAKNLKAERQRQQIKKAQQKIASISASAIKPA